MTIDFRSTPEEMMAEIRRLHGPARASRLSELRDRGVPTITATVHDDMPDIARQVPGTVGIAWETACEAGPGHDYRRPELPIEDQIIVDVTAWWQQGGLGMCDDLHSMAINEPPDGMAEWDIDVRLALVRDEQPFAFDAGRLYAIMDYEVTDG